MDGPTVTAAAAALGAAVALVNAHRQDRRARFSQMVTILSQLDGRFEGAEMKAVRAKAARWLLDGSDEADQAGENAARDVLNFFETLAFLHRREAVDADAVWHYFASWLLPYYQALQPLIRRAQKDDPNIYREFGTLETAVFQIERDKRDWRGTEQVVSPANIQAVLRAECLMV
jgi:hypothetical protein